jgi:hypothetical protein
MNSTLSLSSKLQEFETRVEMDYHSKLMKANYTKN